MYKTIRMQLIGLPGRQSRDSEITYYGAWDVPEAAAQDIIVSDEPARCLHEIMGLDIKDYHWFIYACERDGVIPRLMVDTSAE